MQRLHNRLLKLRFSSCIRQYLVALGVMVEASGSESGVTRPQTIDVGKVAAQESRRPVSQGLFRILSKNVWWLYWIYLNADAGKCSEGGVDGIFYSHRSLWRLQPCHKFTRRYHLHYILQWAELQSSKEMDAAF